MVLVNQRTCYMPMKRATSFVRIDNRIFVDAEALGRREYSRSAKATRWQAYSLDRIVVMQRGEVEKGGSGVGVLVWSVVMTDVSGQNGRCPPIMYGLLNGWLGGCLDE